MIPASNKKGPIATVRCAIYTRKSTEEGLEQEFNSLDAQRESAEAYIVSQKSEGWECIPEHYADGGFSGGNMERPALDRLLRDIEAGKVDCVVVYKVDRLSRSLLDFAKIMDTFEKYSVSFVSVTQQFNTSTSMGRLVLNVLLSFAQFEREIIGERIRDKIAAQRRKGKWAGGMPVLGYDVDRLNCSPKLVINADEANQVRRIFDLYLQRESLLSVADELEHRGWCNKTWKTKKNLPRGGKPFDKCTVYNLLINPIYIGKIKHKENLFDGEHEAIIPPETFRQVQEILQRNGRTGGAVVRNRYGALLKGLLFCHACQRAMVHTFTGRGKRFYRYYTCTHAIKSGRKRCPSGSLPAAEIENAVVDQIRGMADDLHLRGEVLSQARKNVDSELADLQTTRRDLGRELARHDQEDDSFQSRNGRASSNHNRTTGCGDRTRRPDSKDFEADGVGNPVRPSDLRGEDCRSVPTGSRSSHQPASHDANHESPSPGTGHPGGIAFLAPAFRGASPNQRKDTATAFCQDLLGRAAAVLATPSKDRRRHFFRERC